MKRALLLMIVALAVGALAPTAHAGMVLTLTDGTDTLTLSDSDLDGIIVFGPAALSSTSVWTINSTQGFSKPAIGGQTDPKVDLFSFNVTSGGPGTLTIMLTDTGFVWPLGSGTLISQIGGTTEGTVQLTQILDPDNSEFAVTNSGNDLSLVHPALGPGAFASTLTGSLSVGNPFSITEIAVITHGAGDLTTSFDAYSKVVPVPGAILLGILGLGVVGIKLRKYA